MEIELLTMIDSAVDSTQFTIYDVDKGENIATELSQEEAHEWAEENNNYFLCSYEIENDCVCLNVSK